MYAALAITVLILLAGGGMYLRMRSAPPDQQHILIVLGNHRKSNCQKRVMCAMSYLARESADYVLFAGKGPGIQHGKRHIPEAEYMRWYYEQRRSAMDAAEIIVEKESMTTWENIRFAVRRIDERFGKNVPLLVTILSTHEHVHGAARSYLKTNRGDVDTVRYILCPTIKPVRVTKSKKKK